MTPVAPDDAKWSGDFAIPRIGEHVIVRINGFAAGEVLGYFVEDGWLGLYIRPDHRPEWHLKQNPGRNYCMVFGAECAKE